MRTWSDRELEMFIKRNKDVLVDGCRPSVGHEDKFLMKLKSRFKKRVDVIPSFIKLWIAVFLIYLVAVGAWYDIKYRKPSKILNFMDVHVKK